VTTKPDHTDDLRRIRDALAAVTDPEIPVVSVVDLGLIDGVRLEAGRVTVRMLPTFVGCPALDVMRREIESAVRGAGFDEVAVEVAFDPPWTSERISPAGREKLRRFGVAPPHGPNRADIESNFHRVACPNCGSRDTRLESVFGPTLCRAIHYCDSCRQSFEHFKPVG